MLHHSFFSQDTNVEIDLTIPRVEGHPNSLTSRHPSPVDKDMLGEPTFPSAFLRKLTQPREPVPGMRLKAPLDFAELAKAELAKAEEEKGKGNKEEERAKGNDERVKVKAEEEKVKPTERATQEHSTLQPAVESARNVIVSHITLPKKSVPSLAQTSTEDSGLANTMRPLVKHASLSSLKLQPAERWVVVHMLLDARVYGASNGKVRVSQRVDLCDDNCPWGCIEELVKQINAVREERKLEKLSRQDTALLRRGFCRALIEAIKKIKGQFEENDCLCYRDLFNYLRSVSQTIYISCLIPAHIFNDDPNSDYVIATRFPVSNMVTSLSEAIHITNDALESAIREVRKKNNLKELDAELKEELRQEIEWLLEFKVGDMH